MMELSHEVCNGVLVLKPKKRIDSNTAQSFEDQSTALIGAGPNKVVIDFSDLAYISSAGLRVLLIMGKCLKSSGGMLTLCGVRDNVKDVIEVSGFASIFGVHAGVREASVALGA
jgi:anti-anti-sigma factor